MREYCSNKGIFGDILIWVSENEVVRWENLDFILIEVWEGDTRLEFSPWGPIHFLIVLGALIYVRKRWD